ncbi:hypothetical protein [Chitiniphilus shinanonensis]|uniref:hypothetical protein n=1 Tax=Chitiniphilus shinanonensis TaxID=553088 RepID=UPI0030453C63
MPTSRENIDATRQAVRALLERSEAFNALDTDKRRQLANDLVQIGTQLAEPGGQRLAPTQQAPAVRALAEQGLARSGRKVSSAGKNTQEDGTFVAQGAREGAEVAGALLTAVNFPEFVSGLIDGVFHSIVGSSIQQMEAYAKLVADVAKSLNEFRDENTTANQGRDHLVEQFPDVFQLSMDTGEFGGDFGGFGGDGEQSQPAGPRVVLRQDVDERQAIARINQSLPLEQPITRLDDSLVEALLVPAARSQIASSRQQLLATTVMLGMQRVVVTDGKISAKVMYDFQARDNMQFRKSAQSFDYGDQYSYASEGESETDYQGGSRSRSNSKDNGWQDETRDASYYSKGKYKNSAQPVLKLAAASQTSQDASLTTKAQLAGVVEVNFKSDYLPLDKLANPESIAAIQMNAQPGMVKTIANRPAAPAPAGTAPTPATPTA